MKNIGSITSIHYALVTDIDSISAPDENGAVNITFQPGKSFSPFSFSPESASFPEEEQAEDAGSYYAQSCSFRCPKIGTVQHAIIRDLNNRDLILVVKDGNGISVVMGTIETPVRLKWKILRPESPGGYNGYEVSLRANCLEPAPFLDESFVIS